MSVFIHVYVDVLAGVTCACVCLNRDRERERRRTERGKELVT